MTTEKTGESGESGESGETRAPQGTTRPRPKAVCPGTLRFRWAVNVSAWEPSEAEFSWACSTLILDTEVAQVDRYKFFEDRKRALVSLVLQRTAGVKYWEYRAGGVDLVDERSDGAGAEGREGGESGESGECGSAIDACIHALEDVCLGRTKGRKPYIVKGSQGGAEPPARGTSASNDAKDGSATVSIRLPMEGNADNFNYNVSHDGWYVVLASELYCLCGCDVSSAGSLLTKCHRGPQKASQSGMDRIRCTLKAFEKQLTAKEWEAVYGEAGEVEVGERDGEERVKGVARRFAKYWSLKEAYVKAIGLGLGYDLGRVEFEVMEGGRAGENLSVALVSIDGALSEDWCCYLQRLGDDEDHWVSVARGPVEDVVDALGGFAGSFGMPDMGRDMLNRVVFQEQEPAFEELRFDDVIRMGYGDAVHRTWLDRFGGDGGRAA